MSVYYKMQSFTFSLYAVTVMTGHQGFIDVVITCVAVRGLVDSLGYSKFLGRKVGINLKWSVSPIDLMSKHGNDPNW